MSRNACCAGGGFSDSSLELPCHIFHRVKLRTPEAVPWMKDPSERVPPLASAFSLQSLLDVNKLLSISLSLARVSLARALSRSFLNAPSQPNPSCRPCETAHWSAANKSLRMSVTEYGHWLRTSSTCTAVPGERERALACAREHTCVCVCVCVCGCVCVCVYVCVCTLRVCTLSLSLCVHPPPYPSTHQHTNALTRNRYAYI